MHFWFFRNRFSWSFLRLLLLLPLLLLVGCEEYLLERQLARLAAEENAGTGAAITAKVSSTDRAEILDSEPEPCSRLLLSSPRGLACLHCTEPSARPQANAVVNVLRGSCLKNIATNVMVDGTFGDYPEVESFLRQAIDRLTANGRRLFLYLYLGNGPAQRRSGNAEISQYAPLLAQMSPREFRNAINNDFNTKHEYQKIVRQIVPLLIYANNKGVILSLIPFLEHNLRDEDFEELYQLTLDALPPGLPIEVGRSTCEGCFSGNEGGVPDGVFRERHTSSPFFNVSNGVITNDGNDYVFNEQDLFEASSKMLTLNDLEAVQRAAAKKNNTFILWTAEFQGLNNDRRLKNPAKREFVVPTPAWQSRLVEFLRDGLTEFDVLTPALSSQLLFSDNDSP